MFRMGKKGTGVPEFTQATTPKVVGEGDVYGRYQVGEVTFDQLPHKIPEMYKLVHDHAYVALMPPQNFLDLAGSPEPFEGDRVDKMTGLMKAGQAFVPPYLKVGLNQGVAQVDEHEGRHRCSSLLAIHPNSLIPVCLIPSTHSLRQYEPNQQDLLFMMMRMRTEDGRKGLLKAETLFMKGEAFKVNTPEPKKPLWTRLFGS